MKKILAIIAIAFSSAAWAQTSEFVNTVPEAYLQKDTNVTLGVAALSVPKYTGSDERRLAAYPMFDVQWKSGAFFSATNGLGYNFSKKPALQYGLRLSLEGARDESRSSKLNGLGDVNTAVEPGAFANLSLSENYALVSSVRYGSGTDHNGLQFSVGGRFSTALSENHRISATVRANWANSAYMQSYFGVNAQQSAASGYSQFTPSSGVTDIKLSASWRWALDSNWSIVTGASASRLQGDASRSPFVFQKNPVTVFSVTTYRF
ncbi:MipA/OmpV family protein [Undibacterium squillarum]|uniref:MltA-interacting MipA family protein n=1 Tax=Undibacterium squillarum TaxID=1131567 RepID=A0ABQ2Y250_9BURK|nr:MipA/OmpV family protein [Undibacterium squillarum]GGX50147.1 MltA-interacting MipA family protein [Undibacterium squillarum]